MTLGLAQKLRRRYAETVRELPERADADVALTSLGVADVVGRQAAEVGEGFLRKAALFAQRAYRVAEGAVSGAEHGHPRTLADGPLFVHQPSGDFAARVPRNSRPTYRRAWMPSRKLGTASAWRMTARNPYKHMVPATAVDRPGTVAQEVLAPMHTQPNPGESEEFARLDGAILGLLVDPDDQRPWSEDEIARTISTPGNVHDALERLRQVGLVHRWNRLVSATCAAVRSEEISQEHDDNPMVEEDRRMEGEILYVLLRTRDVLSMSEKDIRRALRIKKKNKVGVIDALHHLDAAGLIDRPGGLAVPTEAAVRFDYIEDL